MTAEILLMWTAVTAYAIGTVLFIVGVIFGKERFVTWAFWISLLGMLPQLGAFGVRWGREGHGPILGFYEATSTLSFTSVLAYALLSWRQPRLRPLGVIVMPVVMLLLAVTVFSSKSGMEITGGLASWWLVIHVLFSNLAFASFVASFALAGAYLLRSKSAEGKWAKRLERLPAQDIVDDLSSRCVAAGFLFWGVMIASGAIWANESWGRYWGWDPIETWSLIVWLVYAVYLHVWGVMGWRGERRAWIAVVALPLCAFSLLGIPIVFQSVHAGYLRG